MEEEKEIVVPITLPIHSMSIKQVMVVINSNPQGLNEEDLPARIRKYGRNLLPKTKNASFLNHIFDQMNSPLMYVLLASATVTIGLSNLVEGMVILGVVAIDVSLGLWLQDKSERSAQSLKAMLSQSCRVRRNNEILTVDSGELTVGDIFLLETGDIVPADGRIISASGLFVMESLITGELHPVPKAPDRCVDVRTPLSERSCMVYSGTQVTKGTAVCVAIDIGLYCEVGKIHSSLTRIKDPKTPLVKELEKLESKLVIFILIFAALAMGIASFRGYNITESFNFAITIAIAAIPEELPSCVTIAFKVGIEAMSSHKAIVKILYAAETLGSVSVICSEKSGTLTKNEMVLHFLCTEDICYEVTLYLSLSLSLCLSLCLSLSLSSFVS
jgi:magnesium-transporting ATPase (P-type)